MQPYIFPYIGYFQLVHSVDKFVFYDDVSYIRQGWVNRNRILISGSPAFFTVPLEDASSFRNISETRIHQRLFVHWSGKFMKTLSQNYRRFPGCEQVLAVVEKTLGAGCEFIGELSRASILDVLEALGVTKNVVSTSAIYQNESLSGVERVLDICKREGADTYINASGGRTLYDRQTFAACGITLKFLQANIRHYPQGGADFCPALSILDVLMTLGFEGTKELMNNYILD